MFSVTQLRIFETHVCQREAIQQQKPTFQWNWKRYNLNFKISFHFSELSDRALRVNYWDIMAVSISGLRRNIKNVAHNYTDAQVRFYDVLHRLMTISYCFHSVLMTFHNVFSFVKCSDVYKSFDDIAPDYFWGKINLIEGLVVSFHSEG